MRAATAKLRPLKEKNVVIGYCIIIVIHAPCLRHMREAVCKPSQQVASPKKILSRVRDSRAEAGHLGAQVIDKP